MAVDIKSALKEAVKEATNFLKVEIQELHTENARLQKANEANIQRGSCILLSVDSVHRINTFTNERIK